MDYFNESEREKQRRFAQYRDEALDDIVTKLMAKGITPNHVTAASVFLLILAALLSPTLPVVTFILGCFYIALDGLDGPLARKIGWAHRGGAIIDMVADQAGVVVLSAVVAFVVPVNPIVAVLFSNFYIAFIVLAVFANENNIPLFYAIRVKYLFFILVGISLLFDGDYVSYFMWVFTIYYAIGIVRALAYIHRFYTENPPS
ncbi:CDP-alcohol phosphatidyltransferase family protein [Magnetococcales bacterium HHB-1]